MKELHTLRVSVARVAQSMGIDNHLGVTGKAYEELHALAQRDRGWNDLCGRIQEHAERIQHDNEDLRRQYHENEARATPEDYAGSYDDPILEDRPRSSFASARECAIDEQADMFDEREEP